MELVVKNLLANAGDLRDMSSIPGSGKPPGGGHGNPLQYSCLGNPPGQRSLVGYSPWGHKELEQLSTYTQGSMKHFTDLDLELLTGYKV